MTRIMVHVGGRRYKVYIDSCAQCGAVVHRGSVERHGMAPLTRGIQLYLPFMNTVPLLPPPHTNLWPPTGRLCTNCGGPHDVNWGKHNDPTALGTLAYAIYP